VEAVQPAVEEGQHTLEVDSDSAPLWVDGDPVRLTQVIANLLTNAVKYTPPRGHIRLAIRRDGERAMVTISDNGIGIPPAMLDEIFGMFTQIKRESNEIQGGLGIGLALARQLVEKHGGTIAASSAGHDQGATLTVCLPWTTSPEVLLHPDTPDSEQAASCLPDAALPMPVLVVDDNRDSAESLALLLELSGYRCRIAHDGIAALAAAADFAPRIVLLDIGLPGMDGFEVARRLRALPHAGDMLLVAITGWGTQADVALAHAAGFDVHLTKPVDYSELTGLLARALPAPQPACGGE